MKKIERENEEGKENRERGTERARVKERVSEVRTRKERLRVTER